MRPLASLPAIAVGLVVAALAPSAPSAAAQPPTIVTVTDVLAGDTLAIQFADGATERLRLVGIDAPDVGDPNRPVLCHGPEAATRAADLALGREAELELDVEPRDRHGRLLGYLWLGDRNLSIQLAAEGFAAELVVPPNVKYAGEIGAAAASAREQGLGLWGACGGPAFAADDYEEPAGPPPGEQWPDERQTAPPSG